MLPPPNSSIDAIVILGQATQEMSFNGILVLISVITLVGLLIIIISNELL